jgi:hypothetical protein
MTTKVVTLADLQVDDEREVVAQRAFSALDKDLREGLLEIYRGGSMADFLSSKPAMIRISECKDYKKRQLKKTLNTKLLKKAAGEQSVKKQEGRKGSAYAELFVRMEMSILGEQERKGPSVVRVPEPDFTQFVTPLERYDAMFSFLEAAVGASIVAGHLYLRNRGEEGVILDLLKQVFYEGTCSLALYTSPLLLHITLFLLQNMVVSMAGWRLSSCGPLTIPLKRYALSLNGARLSRCAPTSYSVVSRGTLFAATSPPSPITSLLAP